MKLFKSIYCITERHLPNTSEALVGGVCFYTGIKHNTRVTDIKNF